MGGHEQIEQLLLAELNDARTAYEGTKKAFSKVVANTPSGSVNSLEMARVNHSAEPALVAMQSYMKALSEFSDFVLYGTVPDRLKGR